MVFSLISHDLPKILAQHLAIVLDIEGTPWYHLYLDFRFMFPFSACFACLCGMASLIGATDCDGHVEDLSGASGFLQVKVETHSTAQAVQSMHSMHSSRQVYKPETVTPLLHFFSHFSEAVVMLLYLLLLLLISVWLLRGLPTKEPQDASVKEGCPRSWLIFLCTTYGFIFCTTDQYVPSLPQMGVDLSGSQGVMSATVQLNFIVKSIAGLFTAGISDHIGRRPVTLICLSLLAFATFGCACAPNINWFLASRILQGLGEALEPVIYAACRDYFSKVEERIVIISWIKLIGITGQIVAPIFGGFASALFNWRFSFFCLAIVWAASACYAARYMVESCPDNDDANAEGTYLRGIWRILAPASLCNLLTQMCAMTSFTVFNANIGYVAQVSYGQSSIATATILLVWALLDALGVGVMQTFRSACGLSILQTGRFIVVMMALSGILSMILGIYAEHLWSYLIACFSQSLCLAAAMVPLNVLYSEPLEDCAGLAASVELMLKYVPPCLYSMICTESLIDSGVQSYMNLQSIGYVAGPVFYIGYEVFQRLQPNETAETNLGKDPDNSEEPENCKSLDVNSSEAKN